MTQWVCRYCRLARSPFRHGVRRAVFFGGWGRRRNKDHLLILRSQPWGWLGRDQTWPFKFSTLMCLTFSPLSLRRPSLPLSSLCVAVSGALRWDQLSLQPPREGDWLGLGSSALIIIKAGHFFFLSFFFKGSVFGTSPKQDCDRLWFHACLLKVL